MKDTTALLFNSDDNFHAGFHTNELTYGLLICCVLRVFYGGFFWGKKLES